MAQQDGTNAMDVSDDGYETDDTIIDREDGYNTDEERRLNQYYRVAPRTPPRANRDINPLTPATPPTRLLTNSQIPGQVYKRVIDQHGTIRMVPFTTADYNSGQQPFDITGRAINRNQLPRIQPRRLFDEEGGAPKSSRRSKRRRTTKLLRKRRTSRKRKTNNRRKTRSKK